MSLFWEGWASMQDLEQKSGGGPWEETQEKPSEIGGNREKNVENQGECIRHKKDGVGNGVKYPWEV